MRAKWWKSHNNNNNGQYCHCQSPQLLFYNVEYIYFILCRRRRRHLSQFSMCHSLSPSVCSPTTNTNKYCPYHYIHATFSSPYMTFLSHVCVHVCVCVGLFLYYNFILLCVHLFPLVLCVLCIYLCVLGLCVLSCLLFFFVPVWTKAGVEHKMFVCEIKCKTVTLW